MLFEIPAEVEYSAGVSYMPITILVADDEPKVQSLIRKFLEPEGFAILTANNGVEALEALRNNRIDLLILDVMMPQKDAVDVLDALRLEPARFPNPRILMFCAEPNTGSPPINAGVVTEGEIPFLTKRRSGVGDPNVLRRVVREILASPPLHRFSIPTYRYS